jgi:hypothetical protein
VTFFPLSQTQKSAHFYRPRVGQKTFSVIGHGDWAWAIEGCRR